MVAMIWSGADVFSRQGLQFVLSVVLARLLGPNEYGTIALLYIFIELAAVFGDSGFSASLVQRQDLTVKDESTVFWFHVISGSFLAILLYLCAPWISEFYDKPILIPLMWVMALAFFVSSIGNIHHVLLTKHLDFKRPMKVSVSAGFISGSTAILLAFQGYGVWALAAQTLVSSIVTTSLLWLLSDWRPRFVFDLATIRRLYAYGGYLMLADILMVSYNRIYTLYIGKVYSVDQLGIYSRADNTKQMPLDILSKMYVRVAFPIFSKTANDKGKLLRGVQYALKGIMLVTVPIMVGLMVSAEEFIIILFGDKWVSVAPILKILCLAGLFWPLQILNMNVQKSLGKSKILFKTEILKKVIGIFFVILSLPYGIIGIAWSQVFYGVIGFIINSYFSGKFIGYGFCKQSIDILPVFLISTFMAVVVYLFGYHYELDPLPMLIAKTILGGFLFSITCVIFKLDVIKDIKDIFQLKRVVV